MVIDVTVSLYHDDDDDDGDNRAAGYASDGDDPNDPVY
jgi:hypothetical protein